ncbi:MAG: copper amine oxidase N-terminal domain-containing protein, partial [Oscillospiraceae bacterium]
TSIYATEPIKVILDGEEMTNITSPFKTEKEVLVPIRPIFEALGSKISWDNKRSIVSTTCKKGAIQISVGSPVVALNANNVIIMSTYPRMINDTTMIPLSFVSQAMDVNVSFLEGANTVNISTE